MSKSRERDQGLILSRTGRIEVGGIIVVDCLVAACPGTLVGGSLFTVALYRGPVQEWSWRTPESDRIRSRVLVPGNAFIDASGEPNWVRYQEPAAELVVALKLDYPTRVAMELELAGVHLTQQIGIEDETIQYFARLFEHELVNDGASGRVYLESLTEALTVNLLCRYAEKRPRQRHIRGGLSPASLRRVVDYIEAHLREDIALEDLASLVGLSTHHFGQAFKASTGVAPYRYLMQRRIHRAKRLLLAHSRPIADIAVDVGFANQSHLTLNFRKLVGTTPSRYRSSVLDSPTRPYSSRP
jgi:AraC family transcriptional regulator